MADSVSESRNISEVVQVITTDILEEAIRKSEGTENITVKNFTTEWASKIGDNMATYVLRVKVTAQRDDAEEEHSLIVKTTKKNEHLSEMVLKARLFQKEIGAYTKIVPALIQMQENIGIKPIVPSVPIFCYGREDSTNVPGIVIVKDLRPKGFTMIDKRQGADLDHCKLVMKELATWHALTLALKNRDVKKLRRDFEFVFHEAQFGSVFGDMLKTGGKKNIGDLLDVVQNSSSVSTEIKERARKLLEIQDRVLEEVQIAIRPDESFGVICHGDSWVNNMLFRYENEKPVAISLLDLQVVRYSIPTSDLAYFLFLSTSRSLRKAHLQELLELYHTTFMSVLRHVKFECPEFTLDVVKRMFKKSAVMGILVGITAIPFFLASQETYENYQKMRNEATSKEEYMKRYEELSQKSKIENFNEVDVKLKECYIGFIEDAVDLEVI